MNHEELLGEIEASKPWFHTLDFGGGVLSPGVCSLLNLQMKMEIIAGAVEFAGKTVLDVGAWNGYFTFEAEKLGADVTALDSFCWNGSGVGTKSGFDLAHQRFNSRAQTIELDVLDISESAVGRHDIVLFLGVIYHMKHPLLALEKIASVANEMVFIETATDLCTISTPACAYYPKDELGKDNTNWWGPNPAAIISMMETVGLKNCRVLHKIQATPEQGRAILCGSVR